MKTIQFQKQLSLLLIIIILLSGCASLKYAKRALKYEEAGMYNLAVENYLLSLSKKNENNDKARIGLMRSSKRYSDEFVTKIDEAYNALNDELVVKHYQALVNLKKNVEVYKVDFEIDSKTTGKFLESKNRYLKTIYASAQELMDKEMFDEANIKFREILTIDKNYERANEFSVYCFCEPLYRTAKLNIQNKLYRSAYYNLDKVLKVKTDFKDSKELQLEALQNGLLTIAIKSINNSNRFPFLYEQTVFEIKNGFSKNTNPFLKLVSLENTQAMLNEQKKALENNLSFDASALIPVRVFLVGDIITSEFWFSKKHQIEKKAYLRYTDTDETVKFKKVYYYEIKQSSNAICKLNYEFVSVETANILTNDKLEKTYTDKVHYATSRYNINDLFPADWGDGQKDTMYTDFLSVASMKSLFKARNTLLTQQDFERNFAKYAAQNLIKKINDYDPEK